MIDSIDELSAKAKMELVSFLQPWFAATKPKGVGGGGITEVTSTDMSVTVTDPTGPIVDLSTELASGIRFNHDNEGGWLEVVTNDHFESPDGEVGVFIQDTTSEGVDISARDSGNTKNAKLFITPDVADLGLSGGGATPFLSLQRSAGRTQLTGELYVLLSATGKTLSVFDSGNNPVFEVRNDGSVHIKTGTSVIADL